MKWRSLGSQQYLRSLLESPSEVQALGELLSKMTRLVVVASIPIGTSGSASHQDASYSTHTAIPFTIHLRSILRQTARHRQPAAHKTSVKTSVKLKSLTFQASVSLIPRWLPSQESCEKTSLVFLAFAAPIGQARATHTCLVHSCTLWTPSIPFQPRWHSLHPIPRTPCRHHPPRDWLVASLLQISTTCNGGVNLKVTPRLILLSFTNTGNQRMKLTACKGPSPGTCAASLE